MKNRYVFLHHSKERGITMYAELTADRYVLAGPSPCYRPQVQQKWVILYTLSGQGMIHDQDHRLECCTGSIDIIPPGMQKSVCQPSHHRLEGICCSFTAHPQWSILLKSIQDFCPSLHIHIDHSILASRVQHAFERLLEYCTEPVSRYDNELSFHTLSEILLSITVYYEPQEDRTDSRITEIIQYLQEHYKEDLRIEHLAQRVCLSPSRLLHLYKAETGETIVDTVTRMRLEQAEYLLRFTPQYINEIAYEVGFNSQTYFSRKFVEHFGVNPSTFRQGHTLQPIILTS